MESGENPVEDDGLDSASTFQDAKHPTGKTVLNPGILELRLTGRKDPLDLEIELLKERGFVMSGLRKMLEDPNIYRAYFVKQLPVEVDEEQTIEPAPTGKIESEIMKRLAARQTAKLAKADVITQSEMAFRAYAANLQFSDFDCEVKNYDKSKFETERLKDDSWILWKLSTDTTRKGNFRETVNIVKQSLAEANLRGPWRYISCEHNDEITDLGGRAEANCRLQQHHEAQLKNLFDAAYEIRKNFQLRNPGETLPDMAR